MQFSDEVNWAVFDFALAVAFLAGAGLLLELASRKPGSLILRAGGAAFGLAAIVLGEADDAPGLVLVGVLLIAATAATTLRASRLEEGRA
jgi:hypothetical protein